MHQKRSQPWVISSKFRGHHTGLKTGTQLVCAVKGCLAFSGCNSHPATGSLQPVAIGAAVEVTKPVEAFETDVSLRRCSEPTGRNASER